MKKSFFKKKKIGFKKRKEKACKTKEKIANKYFFLLLWKYGGKEVHEYFC